jgi:hypothetical protein
MKVIAKRLTWDELANIFDKQTGEHARIQKMDTIFKWAEKQTDKFVVDDDGCLCQIIKEISSDRISKKDEWDTTK